MLRRGPFNPPVSDDKGTSLSDVGEFGVIERLQRILGTAAVPVGIGDDAAVLDVGGPDYLLATVDMQVEGVHFLPSADARAVGQRALAVNLSDIASMGGLPTYALVSIAAQKELKVSYLEDLYQAMAECAAQYSMSIVGGNLSGTSGPLAIDVTLLGSVPRDEVVLRRGARPGDALFVSGFLGAAAAGRRVPPLPPPEPRVRLGRLIARNHLASAMLDISDGLAGDIHHLTAASGVGAVIEEHRLPIAAAAVEAARLDGLPPSHPALFGGEDYELLLAAHPDSVEALESLSAGVPLTRVGRIVPRAEGVTLHDLSGARVSLPPAGWQHF